ncbi:MAG TPA: DoxX family protein [Gemmatimonadaceae bacterium]|nr:DoxX family protein [Gemmatimonadaceae bacterium]
MATAATPISRAHLWTGRILSGLAILFLVFDTVIKLIARPEVAASMQQLGYPTELSLVIGIIELVCLVLYIIPATSVLGAILFTGYLGGAIATHLRLENPLFTHILFPTYIAALIWGGLYLRDVRVRTLVALRG